MFEQLAEKWAIGTIIWAASLIFSFLTIINVVMKARTAAGAWAWSLAVLTLPFVAIPLYWILGRQIFRGYMERMREARKANEQLFDDLSVTLSPHFAELDETQRYYGGVLEHLSERRFTRDNEVCLLIDGEQTFEAIFEAIREARDYVLVQFFIVKDDRLGQRFKDLLLEKAAEGVRIRFLYDEIGSSRLGKSYLRELREGGVDVTDFHSTQGPSNRFQINFRNHRKIVIADGKVGFAGGHNVGDEYLGESERFGRWRDTHVKIVGPAVLSLQMVFLGDWYWATRTIPEGLNWHSVTESQGMGCGGEDMRVLTLPTGPVETVEGGTMFFLNAITRARERIWITSPYFVTDESVRSTLQLASLRGVDVRIMIPAIPDKWIPWLAAFSYLEEMEAAGVTILRYGDGFLHQKVILVDRAWASVGTANLDNRSLRLNFEISVVVMDEAFAEQVASMLEVDFEECKPATGRDYSNRPLWFRVGVRLARLASPVL